MCSGAGKERGSSRKARVPEPENHVAVWPEVTSPTATVVSITQVNHGWENRRREESVAPGAGGEEGARALLPACHLGLPENSRLPHTSSFPPSTVLGAKGVLISTC